MPKRAPWVPQDTERLYEIDAEPERIAEGEEIERQIEEAQKALKERTAAVYHDKPAAFVLDCIHWQDGEAPTRYQLANLQRLVKHGRLAVRGPHGLGKTTTNAWTLLWFALTRDAAREDWKIATTASAWLQLTHYLWPEVHKWSRRLDWKKVGREAFTRDELLRHNLRLEYGEAFAAACEDPAKLEGMHADQILYIYDEAKRLDTATPIPTPHGWSTMGELRVGDEVLDEAGRPTRITYVSPIVEGRPCSRVTFSDGSSLVADDGHLWSTLSLKRRQIAGARHRNDPRYKRHYEGVADWREHWDLSEVVETRGLGDRAAIPTTLPLDLPDAALPIDPYVLGAWLGDGHSLHGVITTMDPEVVERFALAGHPLTRERRTSQASTYGVAHLRTRLREGNLLGDKHIPRIYLRASAEQRLELLRGLMDTDGTVMAGARVSFTSTRRVLAEGVAELVRSFGWKVQVRRTQPKLNGVPKRPAYRLRWSADICPFHLPRKARKWGGRGAQASAATIRTVASVEHVASVSTRCIAVDSPRHLYLAGEHFIPTHNTIPAETFDASEGAFSGAGASDRMEAYALASSTPGEPIGRFYEIHAHKPGLQSWTTVHVKLAEAIKARRVSEDWEQEKQEQWGRDSAIYINRVLGNFAAAEEDGVIALGHVEAAIERWEKLADASWPELGTLTALGADIARSGGDRTVLALRYGYLVKELRRYQRSTTMETAGHIASVLSVDEEYRKAVVDVAGIGAGVVDRLKEEGFQIIPFNSSERSDLVDMHGELRFINARAAAWWNLRDMLLPESGFEVALPPDELLIGDLTAPKWKMSSGGKVQVESKEDIRKRIGRSTDDGDAVVMAFYTEVGPTIAPPIFTTRTSRWAPFTQRAF